MPWVLQLWDSLRKLPRMPHRAHFCSHSARNALFPTALGSGATWPPSQAQVSHVSPLNPDIEGSAVLPHYFTGPSLASPVSLSCVCDSFSHRTPSGLVHRPKGTGAQRISGCE